MSFRDPKGPDLREHVEGLRRDEMLPPLAAPDTGTALVPLAPTPEATIRRLHKEYEASLCGAADKAVEIGRLLNARKDWLREAHGHGHWEEWFDEQGFGFTLRTGQNYMTQARKADAAEARRKQSNKSKNEVPSFLKRRNAAEIVAAAEAKKA